MIYLCSADAINRVPTLGVNNLGGMIGRDQKIRDLSAPILRGSSEPERSAFGILSYPEIMPIVTRENEKKRAKTEATASLG